ncbi:unnamed protein product [Dicrocoelium dendriticum]|nr:unnamed protein product [Dicrocoelium dendriticum]
MSFLFGSRKTVDEQLRANKRAVARAVRELDSEKRRLEQDNTRLKGEIKKLAKQNEMDPVRILAKQLIRNNHYIKRFTLMRTNLEVRCISVSHHHTLGRGIEIANSQIHQRDGSDYETHHSGYEAHECFSRLPQLQQIMMKFEKESGMLDAKEEMMSDAIDDALGDDDVDESENVVNAILAELGIEMNEQLAGLPNPSGTIGTGVASDFGRTPIPASGPAGPGGGGGVGPAPNSADGTIDEDDLEARLARLKRN